MHHSRTPATVLNPGRLTVIGVGGSVPLSLSGVPMNRRYRRHVAGIRNPQPKPRRLVHAAKTPAPNHRAAAWLLHTYRHPTEYADGSRG